MYSYPKTGNIIISSFLAKLWHIVIYENRVPAKSRRTGSRSEYIKTSQNSLILNNPILLTIFQYFNFLHYNFQKHF